MQRASCWRGCHTQAPAALHRGLRAGGSPYFHIDKFRALGSGDPTQGFCGWATNAGQQSSPLGFSQPHRFKTQRNVH